MKLLISLMHGYNHEDILELFEQLQELFEQLQNFNIFNLHILYFI